MGQGSKNCVLVDSTVWFYSVWFGPSLLPNVRIYRSGLLLVGDIDIGQGYFLDGVWTLSNTANKAK